MLRFSRIGSLAFASSLVLCSFTRAADAAPDEGSLEDPGAAPDAEDHAEITLDEGPPDGSIAEPSIELEQPPAPGNGAISGVIVDTQFREALIEAPVQVLGTKFETVTDTEGRFRIELPPGTYSLRISYELHKPQRVDGLVVAAGRVVRLDAELVPDEGAVEVHEIVEEADTASLEGALLARQRSTAVGDGVGRAEISKSPDRNAAQAAQRVVGATVVGGRFVYVRGLGERYTNALINGVPLPSPEPDRAAVPLDLFASGVLNSLTIAKTFTPDVPGDFAGGSVRIETREIPSEPLLQLGARGAFNSNTTFRERLSSRGGDLDWLGVDDGTRALPDGFPRYSFGGRTKPSGEEITAEERTAAGLQLNSYMSAQRSTAPPDHSVSVVAGNGWKLGEQSKLGLVGSLGYGRSYTVRRDEILRLFEGVDRQVDARGLGILRDYRATTGNVNVGWNAFGSATYQISNEHRVSLLGLRSTLADDRTQYITGFHAGRDIEIHATRLGFVTRALNLGVLSGEHRFPGLANAELDWNLVVSSASRDEPDRRDTVWGRGASATEYRFTQATESGRHFFSEQVETQYGAGFDWTQPLGSENNKLKAGALASLRDRTFTSRTLRFERLRRGGVEPEPCPPGRIDACNDALFVPENIGTVLELRENTQPEDSYDANLDVIAGYVMAELRVTDDLRLVLGERIEHTRQTIDPYDQFGQAQDLKRARVVQTDWLPAAALTWSLSKKAKLRGSLTRTLARPQLRELAPFTFQDYFGGRVTAGNPDLEMTSILNLDTRIEYFPTPRDVLAFSFFLKEFDNPIEPVILSAGEEGSVTYRNADAATLLGIELEARRGLGGLSRALQNFTVVANLTVAHSRIRVPDEGIIALTNVSRPLVNQAPWVVNLTLVYAHPTTATTARLLYNVVGPRVAEVGSMGLDDVYEHPRSLLDLTVQQGFGEHFNVKLEGRNLLNSEVLLTQGCGSDGLFGSTWHLGCSSGEREAVSRYTEGVSVAASAAYEF